MRTIRIRTTRRLALGTGLLVVLALAAKPVQGQEMKERGHDPEEHLSKLQEELSLSEAQLDQIRTIFDEQHAKHEAFRDEDGGDSEARHQVHRQLYEETHARILAVLTEEQAARLETLHEEMKEKHGHGKDRPDNG